MRIQPVLKGPAVYSGFRETKGTAISTDLLNAVLAAVLVAAPALFHDNSGDVKNLHKMYAEAQKRAQYIISTGDTTDLNGLMAAEAELSGYQARFAALAGPVMRRVMATPLEEKPE